jgi:hypothetical protein
MVTSDGDLVSVRESGLPGKAVLLAFCDEVSASSYLCLTREEAIKLAAAIVLTAEWSHDDRPESDRDPGRER